MISTDGCDVLSVVPFSSLCMPRWSEYCRRSHLALGTRAVSSLLLFELSFVSALDNFPISPYMEGCCSSISSRELARRMFLHAQKRIKWTRSAEAQRQVVIQLEGLKEANDPLKHQQTSVALS